MGYRGPGIVGNDDGGDGSYRYRNDPNDAAGSKRYKNDPNDGARPKRCIIGQRYHFGDDETNDDVTLVKTRMNDVDQHQLLMTASDEEEQDVGDNTRIAGDPSSTTRRPLRPKKMFG